MPKEKYRIFEFLIRLNNDGTQSLSFRKQSSDNCLRHLTGHAYSMKWSDDPYIPEEIATRAHGKRCDVDISGNKDFFRPGSGFVNINQIYKPQNFPKEALIGLVHFSKNLESKFFRTSPEKKEMEIKPIFVQFSMPIETFDRFDRLLLAGQNNGKQVYLKIEFGVKQKRKNISQLISTSNETNLDLLDFSEERVFPILGFSIIESLELPITNPKFFPKRIGIPKKHCEIWMQVKQIRIEMATTCVSEQGLRTLEVEVSHIRLSSAGWRNFLFNSDKEDYSASKVEFKEFEEFPYSEFNFAGKGWLDRGSHFVFYFTKQFFEKSILPVLGFYFSSNYRDSSQSTLWIKALINLDYEEFQKTEKAEEINVMSYELLFSN